MIDRVESHEGTAPPAWNDLASRLCGSVFHSTQWADYQRAASGISPWFLVGYDRSGIASAGAVAYVRRSSRPFLSHVFCSMEVPAHPFMAIPDERMSTDMLQALESIGRSVGCASIQLQSFGSSRSAIQPERQGYEVTNRIEFIVDLTRDLDELWRAIGKDQRERIRKLERLGIATEVGVGRDDLDALRLTRERTHDKRVRLGQSYLLAADEAFYDRLFRWVIYPGIGRLFVARKEGVPVAALMFGVFHARAYSMFSGSSEEGYRLGVQSLLFWRALQQFRAEGMVELNRGGVPGASERDDHPLHGIYRFKLRLGGAPVSCRSGFKVLHTGRHALMYWTDRMRRALAKESGEE